MAPESHGGGHDDGHGEVDDGIEHEEAECDTMWAGTFSCLKIADILPGPRGAAN